MLALIVLLEQRLSPLAGGKAVAIAADVQFHKPAPFDDGGAILAEPPAEVELSQEGQP